MNAIHVSEMDNVATALEPLKKNDAALGVTVLQDIRKGHKFATLTIKKGEPVIKYAAHIGIASCDIEAGEWVHIHNIESERGRGDTDSSVRDIKQKVYGKTAIAQNDKTYKLMGYRRDDGSFGFRNHILVMPSVHCANKVVENIANAITYSGEIKNDETNVVYVTHQHGCSELNYDARQTQDVLVGTGANSNVHSVLVVGLGCEGVPAKDVAEKIRERAPYKNVEYFTIQEVGGVGKSIKKGVQIVKKMLAEALKMQKSEGDLSDVVFGTECGGSDSFSGLSANPSLGKASDMVIQHGGSVILAETTELIGAEHILASRAINNTVKEAILNTIRVLKIA